jgi:hypothetical protein
VSTTTINNERNLMPPTTEDEEAQRQMEATPITITIELSEQALLDWVIAGIHQGVRYWCRVDVGEHQAGYRNYFTAKFRVTEPGDGKAVCGWTYFLSLDKVKAGLGVLQKRFKHHFAAIVREDGDARTGDALIQCALFDDIVFS